MREATLDTASLRSALDKARHLPDPGPDPDLRPAPGQGARQPARDLAQRRGDLRGAVQVREGPHGRGAPLGYLVITPKGPHGGGAPLCYLVITPKGPHGGGGPLCYLVITPSTRGTSPQRRARGGSTPYPNPNPSPYPNPNPNPNPDPDPGARGAA
eukprot:scaffold17858_cov52-Phaeocystis_antarctica.AAC.6